MKKLSIKKNNEVVQHCNFESDEAMQAFIQLLADQAPWGKPERWIQDTPMKPLTEEEKAKAKANRKVKGPLGEDITVEVEAEKTKKDKKDKDLKDRVTSLKAIDWSKIKNFNDALPILQALVNEQLKDDE